MPNAHIDPVWIWDWREGMREVIATFTAAADRLDQYPDLFFAASSACYHEWVEPLVAPGASVIAFYTFIQAWGNFFVPFILLQSPKLPAAVTAYQFFGEHSTNYSGLAALSIIFTAVPVIFYVVISHRNGGEPLFAGAIKG